MSEEGLISLLDEPYLKRQYVDETSAILKLNSCKVKADVIFYFYFFILFFIFILFLFYFFEE